MVLVIGGRGIIVAESAIVVFLTLITTSVALHNWVVMAMALSCDLHCADDARAVTIYSSSIFIVIVFINRAGRKLEVKIHFSLKCVQ